MDVGAFADKEETQEGWCRSIGGRYVPEEKVEEVLARRRERKHLNLKKNKAMAERAVDKLEVRLPMGTEKIILRPAGGIDSIKKKLGVFAGNAILEAAGLPPMAEEDIVFNKNNQTILISTPNKETQYSSESFVKYVYCMLTFFSIILWFTVCITLVPFIHPLPNHHHSTQRQN
ncbi:hypothetical protein HPB49_026047 [Dermacentor silvarum]|nr:hypothetical protein HPB49_026047 [Dermacentor silvarum]